MLRFLGLAILPLLIAVALLLKQTADNHREHIHERQLFSAEETANTVELYVTSSVESVRTLAMSPFLQTAQRSAQIDHYLQRFLEVNPHWQGLGLIGSDGLNIEGTRTLPRSLDVSDRPYFREMQRTRQPVVSDALVERVANRPAVVVMAPVHRPEGMGGLAAPLPLAQMEQYLRAVTRPERNATVYVMDGDGRVLLPVSREQVPDRSVFARAHRALSSGQSGTYVDHDQGLLVSYAAVAEYDWGVVETLPLSIAYRPLNAWLWRSVGGLGIAVVLILGTGWFVGGRLSRATQQLDQARRHAEAAQRRSETLAEASRRLVVVPGVAEALRTSASVAAEHLGVCAVPLVERRGQLERDDPIGADTPTGAEAASAAVAALAQAGVLAETLEQGRARTVEPGSSCFADALVAPVSTQRAERGLLVLLSHPGEPFGTEDREVADDLGQRTALMMDNIHLRRDLEQALRARDQLLATVSHDLRNPLAALRLRLEMSLAQLQRDDPDLDKIRAALRRSDLQAIRIWRLVESLLDAERIRTGKPVELDRREVDLVHLVRRVIGEYEETNDRHRLLLHAPAELTGRWDEARLERVLVNLVDNAIKYSPDGGDVTIRIDCEGGREPTAVLEVTDCGIGVPETERDQLFSFFFRGSNTADMPGTGVGLASVRAIVEQHGGTVDVESAVGQGSRFIVHLPVGLARHPEARPRP